MNQTQWPIIAIVGIFLLISIVGSVIYVIVSPRTISIPISDTEAGIDISASPTPTEAVPNTTATPQPSPIPTAEPTVIPTAEPTATPTAEPIAFPVDEVQATLNQVGGTFGIVVYDLTRDEIVYTQNENEVFPAASLVKIPIALTAYYLADQGQIDLDTQLTLTPDQIVGGTGLLQREAVGSTYTIRELSARALYDSDNTAANMVLRHIGGFDQINTLLASLGMQQTLSQRFLMDFEAQQAGRDNITSPTDVADMMRIIAQNDVVGGNELLDAMARTVDQQKIPAFLPPNVVVANKTGVLPAPNGVEHDTSLIRLSNGNEYILVILSKDLSNNQAAITAIATTSGIIFEYEQQRGL